MAPTPQGKRRIQCRLCGKDLTLLPGDATATCMDPIKCRERAHANPRPHPQTASPEAEPSSPEPAEPEEDELDGSADFISAQQRRLATKALSVTHQVIDRIEEAIQNGVDVALKDGTIVKQAVQPMALASLLRELRPVVHEPVRAAEAKDLSDRPLISLNLGDPAVVRDAVAVLSGRRSRQISAAQQTVVLTPNPE